MANPMGISMGSFLSGQLEPKYHFNANQEWASINAWGPTNLLMEAGNNLIFTGLEQSNFELNLVVNIEQPEMRMELTAQPINKDNEPTKGTSAKKGRKSGGPGKGKAKVIPTGHKNTPKGIWIKRSNFLAEG